ncbi:hypothetical protein LTR85_006090 [Meristemomyces frigidus]|nr:hypothetical protein LTR85_006090 [Meristemomyces frigidus]
MQELLGGLRGQQLAINTLVQLLQMDSLSEITQLLQQKAPELKKTVEWTGSLRRLYPSVRVPESIYTQEDRMSVYSAADSMMSSSELEFDFDDIIVNSAAYRRPLAAARHPTPTPPSVVVDGDLIDFSDHDTIQQVHVDKSATGASTLSEDLFGLRFSTTMDGSSFSSSVFNRLEGNEENGEHSKTLSTPPSGSETELQHLGVKRKPVAGPSEDTQYPDNVVSHGRNRSVTPQREDIVPRDDPELLRSDTAGLTPSPRNTQSPTLGSHDDSQAPPVVRMCFKCTSKFFTFPIEPPHEYPLCMVDYFRRLDLLCFSCGEPIEGSCATRLGSEDKFYQVDEREGEIHCFYDYVTSFATRCSGCSLPVLNQFMEGEWDGIKQIWHPECCMIYKHWGVKMSGGVTIKKVGSSWTDEEGCELDAVKLQQRCDSAMALIERTLTVFSGLEERLATAISGILTALQVGQQAAAVQKMAQLLAAVETLFTALESMRERRLRSGLTGTSCSREAKLLRKECVAMMEVIADEPAQPVTQEITGLARYLKPLIRDGLSGSMSHLDAFLEDMATSDANSAVIYDRPGERPLHIM